MFLYEKYCGDYTNHAIKNVSKNGDDFGKN